MLRRGVVLADRHREGDEDGKERRQGGVAAEVKTVGTCSSSSGRTTRPTGLVCVLRDHPQQHLQQTDGRAPDMSLDSLVQCSLDHPFAHPPFFFLRRKKSGGGPTCLVKRAHELESSQASDERRRSLSLKETVRKYRQCVVPCWTHFRQLPLLLMAGCSGRVPHRLSLGI